MPLGEIVARFDGAPFRWWVSGGVALELYAGRSWRRHEDADVGVLRRDAGHVHRWLDGWELAVASGGMLRPWGGEPLAAAASQNNVWVRGPGDAGWRLDLTIGSGDDERWVYRRDPSVVRSWSRAVLWSGDGIPYLAPDLQLLFKSKAPRTKDHEDARLVIPLLTSAGQGFLRLHLPDDHVWREWLDDVSEI